MVDRFKETKQLICIFDRIENGEAVFHGYNAILRANSRQVFPPAFNRSAYGTTLNIAVPEYRLSEKKLQDIMPWEEYRRTPDYTYRPDVGVMLEEEKKKALGAFAQARMTAEKEKAVEMRAEPVPQVA